jgi:GMP synthase-like glutamine amidotransferase
MKLTILQTGDVPLALRPQFGPYPEMFRRMFQQAGGKFDFDIVRVFDGELLPEAEAAEAILITGSSAGVYDDYAWMDPLRQFIRQAYAKSVPMVGVCFGHQIMADALGGVVRKSEKGWGLGRHSYKVRGRPAFFRSAPEALAIACSHQDQVISPPPSATAILSSEFTPHAGLFYDNGAALSFQPHPEFDDDYARALAELRRGVVPEPVVETAVRSLADPSDSPIVAKAITRFLTGQP